MANELRLGHVLSCFGRVCAGKLKASPSPPSSINTTFSISFATHSFLSSLPNNGIEGSYSVRRGPWSVDETEAKWQEQDELRLGNGVRLGQDHDDGNISTAFRHVVAEFV